MLPSRHALPASRASQSTRKRAISRWWTVQPMTICSLVDVATKLTTPCELAGLSRPSPFISVSQIPYLDPLYWTPRFNFRLVFPSLPLTLVKGHMVVALYLGFYLQTALVADVKRGAGTCIYSTKGHTLDFFGHHHLTHEQPTSTPTSPHSEHLPSPPSRCSSLVSPQFPAYLH